MNSLYFLKKPCHEATLCDILRGLTPSFFMFDYNQVFESIHNHKTHLKPSTVCDGVGLFALRDIQKDELLFKFVTNDIKIAAKDLQSTVDPNC